MRTKYDTQIPLYEQVHDEPKLAGCHGGFDMSLAFGFGLRARLLSEMTEQDRKKRIQYRILRCQMCG